MHYETNRFPSRALSSGTPIERENQEAELEAIFGEGAGDPLLIQALTVEIEATLSRLHRRGAHDVASQSDCPLCRHAYRTQ